MQYTAHNETKSHSASLSHGTSKEAAAGQQILFLKPWGEKKQLC